MKKLKFVLCIISILSTGHIYSQGLEIELLAGPALTSLRGNPVVKNNYDPAFNFSTGVRINYFLNEKTLLTGGIFYEKKGGRGESYIVLRDQNNQITAEGTVTYKSSFDYITLPIQWGKRLGTKVKYQFGIGLYAGILLKQEYRGEGPNGQADPDIDNTDLFKRVDVGLSANTSVFIPVNNSFSIKIGVNDHFGLVNVSDVPVKNDGAIKHNSLALLIGLNFKVNY